MQISTQAKRTVEAIDKKINETKISEKNWAKKHWQTIAHNYSKTKYFKEYKSIFEELYLSCNEDFLTQINFKFITAINCILDINTNIRFSNELKSLKNESIRLFTTKSFKLLLD